MTEIDGTQPRQRRWTWNARGQGNRVFYALLIGWLVWLLAGSPTAVVFIGVAVIAYVLETVFFLVRDAYAGTDRQL
jgi:hypothetical protein